MENPTKRRILEQASALFTQRGFRGTSTRAIADAVKIRQQSLFHHFENKQAILFALFDSDLVPLVDRLGRLLERGGPAAPRLHAHLVLDVRAIMTAPFDTRGLYNDDILNDPDFAMQRARKVELHHRIQALVRAGVESGEFRNLDEEFVQQAITGMTSVDMQWVLEAGAKPGSDDPAKTLADFVLRAILADPGTLERVGEESTAVLASFGDQASILDEAGGSGGGGSTLQGEADE